MRPSPLRSSWSLLLLAGCLDPALPPERPSSQGSARPPTKVTAEPLPEYVARMPARSTNQRFELAGGKVGLLVRGERWVVDALGRPQSRPEDSESFSQVAALSKGAGEGFLFWGNHGLFSAKSFDGALTRLASGQVTSAAQGPGFVLVRFDDGRLRVLDSATGGKGPALPLGTVDVAVADDGTVVAATHGGRVFVSYDRGKSFGDISKEVGEPTELIEREGAVFVQNDAGESYRVVQKGIAQAPVPAPPPPPFDATWPLRESPLELALTRGAKLSEGVAIVTDAGNVYQVSTTTGDVIASDKGVLPSNGACVAVSQTDAVLFLCTQSDNASVFKRSKTGSAIALEKTFGLRAPFLLGADDALLFVGPCAGTQSKPGMACARSADGEWVTIDRSGELADTPPGEPLRVVTWVPKPGGAYLVVAGKKGGIWDAKGSAKTRLEESEVAALEPLFSSKTSGRTELSDRFAVIDGNIVGRTSDNVGFRVLDGGKRIEKSPFKLTSVVGARNLVLGRDGDSLWQSRDYGFTYNQVEGPPDVGGRMDDPRSCSELGCVFQQWMRIGFSDQKPRARPPAKARTSSPAAPQPKLLTLRCTATKPMTRKSKVAANDEVAGMGAESLPMNQVFAVFPRGLRHGMFGWIESSSLRAMVTGKPFPVDSPPTQATLSQPRTYRYLEPFDATGEIRRTSLKLSDLMDAARSSAAPPPDFAETNARGQAVPVLGTQSGVLLSSSMAPVVWLRGKDKPLALSLAAQDDTQIESALETGENELTVLTTDWGGRLSARALAPGRSTEPFEVAPVLTGAERRLPDALAQGPDGKVATIRFQLDGPPTADDPALLLRPGEAPLALAPYDSLQLDGSPACETMIGHRAIVQTNTRWLSVTAGEVFDSIDHVGYLRVRWSATQLCLEAAEVHFGSQELPNGSNGHSYIAATFGKKPRAGHIMVIEGAELSEPRTCDLLR